MVALLLFSSCYTYKVSTQAQPGGEYSKPITAHAFFWGLVQKPKDYVGAARFGNALGALRTQGKTFGVFKPLSEIKKIIQQGVLRPN